MAEPPPPQPLRKGFFRADPHGLRPPESPRDAEEPENHDIVEDPPLPASRNLPPPRLRPMGGGPPLAGAEAAATSHSNNRPSPGEVPPLPRPGTTTAVTSAQYNSLTPRQELFSSPQTAVEENIPAGYDNQMNVTSNDFSHSQDTGIKRIGDGATGSSAKTRSTIAHAPSGRFSEVVQERPPIESVEQLCQLQTLAHPVERFFVEYQPMATRGCRSTQVPVEEDEALFNHLAEYTDDDSFFSSGSAVLEEDTRRLQNDPLRGRAIRSVFETLSLRSLTKGRIPYELEDQERSSAPWLKQVHQRAIALHHSSFFIFPAGMKARVIAYNILHHWLTEMLLMLIILVYSMMTAAWSRDTWPTLEKPSFMFFADVFFLCIYAIEFVARLFTSGAVSHSRAYFRSPWHCLDAAVLLLMILNCTNLQSMWNFSAFRLIRVLKSSTYVPIPINMKLLAKSLLRSTSNVVKVSTILFYVLLFFSLVGLQLFSGVLQYRCVSPTTKNVTNQLCRFNQSEKNESYYHGATCPSPHLCVADTYGNPHHGYRSFDSVGHSFLSAFQIMTFQGWTSLLQETSDTTSVAAILYFFLAILICAWIIPSLYLGVFIEKIEKTRRLFVQKQLQLFDGMLLEQRQRLNEAIKLRDFVERDESGKLRRHPIELIRSASRRIQRSKLSNSQTSIATESESGEPAVVVKKPIGDTTKGRSRWTDEQRVQLHLSLTRQRDIASGGERRRRVVIKNDGEISGGTAGLHSQRKGSESIGERAMMVTGDFALGGRVGVVQHHPLTHTIGAAHGTDLPLAVRLDNEEEQLRFLKDYQNPIDNDIMRRTNTFEDTNGNLHPSFVLTSTQRRGGSFDEASNTIRTTTEAAGVIPSRHSATLNGHNTSRMDSNGSLDEPTSKTQTVSKRGSPMPRLSSGQVPEVIIHDPEGGDFRFAETRSQKWGIVRNILHMFTEGYPRIITQYIREHRRMQRRFGLTPLNYVNKYEDDVLRKLRQRRVLQVKEPGAPSQTSRASGDEELVEVNGNKVILTDSDDIGDLSPIQMATNIVRNVPVTPFGAVMLVIVIVNGIFNATRYFQQPEYWETALFVLGIIFTSFFVLEIVVRVIGLGLVSFLLDFNNLLDVTVTILGFVELAYARSNVVTVLNWVRLLRLFRTLPFAPMRRVSRVLLLGFADMLYALFFFSIYMFMWILIGMSFFGGPNGMVDHTFQDYYTRGNFDTFSGASFAVSQAFSYTREEWVYLTWNGMQSRGEYTVLYFMAVVGVAFIARYFFVAVFAWAWQSEEEEEENYAAIAKGGSGGRREVTRLRWFDFTVWRSFKHIHGGFERRDVAPDEVFHLNEDMRKQLRIAEAKERFTKEALAQTDLAMSQRRMGSPMASPSATMGYNTDGCAPAAQVGTAPRYVNVGGQLQRHINPSVDFVDAQVPPLNAPISQFQAENAQLRFARRYSTVPASVYTPVIQDDGIDRPSPSARSSPSDAGERSGELGGESQQNGQEEGDGQYSPRGVSPNATGGRATSTGLQRKSSVLGRFPRLGYDRAAGKKDGGSRSVSASAMQQTGDGNELRGDYVNEGEVNGGSMVYEHILYPGPRLRYKHVMRNQYVRVFERCLDCNTYQQMPLRAPPNVQQRTPEELHAEHCHMAAVRSSRQLVLNAIMGYVRLQKDINQPPTRDAVETVLGQAWSCGMLLFETIEYLSCSDIEQREYRTWDRTLEALQLQQWLIGLHVGEEQVGRATLAYTLAHRKREKLAVEHKSFELSWRQRSFFFISPSNPVRRLSTRIIQSRWFDIFILTVIFIASFCLCFHIPGKANDPETGFVVLRAFDGIFTCIFLVEMIMKWISMGVILFRPEAYFWHWWNVFDFVIVIVSLIGLADQHSALRSIKVLRCFRILIPMRVSNFNRSLSKISSALLDCLPTVANILLLFFINYFVWAVLAVRLLNGLTHSCSDPSFVDITACEDAKHEWLPKVRNFDSFFQSLLTMIEVSVGSKWLDVIYTGVNGRTSEHAPMDDHYLARGFFFIVYYYVSHLILFSLFTASMIYSYLLTKNAAEGVLGITFEHQLWIRMQRMTLQLKPRVKLVPLCNQVSQFLHNVVIRPIFEVVGASVLLLNILTMALHWYGETKSKASVLAAFQYVWMFYFTVEAAMKIGAHGMRAFSRWAFSFDFFVLLLSFIGLIVDAASSEGMPFNVNVLRMLRLGRFFSAAKVFKPMRKQFSLLHEVLIRSAVSLANVTLILFLGVFVFTVLGLHLVGGVPVGEGGYFDDRYTNFNNFGNSLMMTFRLTTLENWSPSLREGMNVTRKCTEDDCSVNYGSAFYCLLLLVFLGLIVLSFYMAVIVDHYVTAARMNTSITRIEDLRRFRDLWSEFDPNGALVLHTHELPKLLESLRPPLGLTSRHNRVELLRLLREYDIPNHRGKVHYHEVLLPLARRVLAMAFSRDTMDYRTTFDTLWRHSEKSLRALPTVLGKRSHATAAQHFAASYVQAVCRRKKACREVQRVRSELWHEGRAVCDELGLPYADYGFGNLLLEGPDPMRDLVPRSASAASSGGKGTQKGASEAENAASSPLWRAGQAESPSSPRSEGETIDGRAPAARLPGAYQPAIEEREKRFGPDVPNALRRHETRSEKLRRKDEERMLQSTPDDAVSSPVSNVRSNSQRVNVGEYQPPLGTDPTSWLGSNVNRGSTVGGPTTESRTSSVMPAPQGPTAPE